MKVKNLTENIRPSFEHYNQISQKLHFNYILCQLLFQKARSEKVDTSF